MYLVSGENVKSWIITVSLKRPNSISVALLERGAYSKKLVLFYSVGWLFEKVIWYHLVIKRQISFKTTLTLQTSNPTNWSNTLKQFFGSVFDHFVGLVLKGLNVISHIFLLYFFTIFFLLYYIYLKERKWGLKLEKMNFILF